MTDGQARSPGPLAAVVTGALLVVVFAVPTRAEAQGQPPTAEDGRALASDLFDSGVKKMERGKCATPTVDVSTCQAARDDFRRAFALYPAGLGALRNLAYVEKGLGLVASASRSFRELARRAPLDPNPVRRPWADFARREVDALEARVPRLKLAIAAPPAPQMTLTLDGAALPEAAWGAEVPVDPGAHVLRAQAPDRAPFEASFTIAEQESHTVSVGVLDVAAPAVTTAPVAAPLPPATRVRVAPLIVAGVGLAGAGTGLVLGALAIKKHGDACDAQNVCEPNGLGSGRALAQTSTWVTGVGAGVLVVGVVWYLLSPSHEPVPAARDAAPAPIAVVPFYLPGGGGVVTTRAF